MLKVIQEKHDFPEEMEEMDACSEPMAKRRGHNMENNAGKYE